MRQAWQGLPDLHVELTAVSGDDERVQQADVLGRTRRLHGRALGLVGLGALLWRSVD